MNRYKLQTNANKLNHNSHKWYKQVSWLQNMQNKQESKFFANIKFN